MKLLKLVILLLLLGGAVALVSRFSGEGGSGGSVVEEKGEADNKGEGVRLEERYGFTGQTVDP